MTDTTTGSVHPEAADLGPRVLRLRAGDEVAVALSALAVGDRLPLGASAVEDVPQGHKVAITDIRSSDPVHKYGQIIGYASQDIASGSHVHVHNLAFSDAVPDATAPAPQKPVLARPPEPRTFQGIRRSDGRIATRNYIGILTSVNCSATVAKLIAESARTSGMLAHYPGIDGVVAITHSSGCGLASDGSGLELLRRTLRGYAQHPNFGALLVVGLGCEVNELDALVDGFDGAGSTPVRSFSIQDAGGTAAAIQLGLDAVRDMAELAGAVERTAVPVSELVLGLKCGGSDSYSGMTANPALGVAADLLIAHGGRAVLCETPEIFGAQHLLAARAADPSVAARLLERVEWWRTYVASNGTSLDNNPSPGNKAGGITTILEKSLGAVAKSGSSPLRAVYEYAEQITSRGLSFMDTPGYDPVSVTGMVAGGANIVCFTTGRGSVFGSRPVPTMKLATNSDMYRRMSGDMDLNCGPVADGELTIDEMGHQIFEAIIATASGKLTHSEEFGFGGEEFVPWQIGAVL